MRILIDGDACPVIEITEEVAGEKNIEIIIFADITHQISSKNQVIVVDKYNQSVDMAIYNCCQNSDIVITQDYGLASLVLSKGAYSINHYGREYSAENIDFLLFQRHIHAKMRRAGLKHSNNAKRTEEDDCSFKKSLLALIERYY